MDKNAERGPITEQLLAWSAGDDRALESVYADLYSALRRLARRALAGERADHTLETGGLIAETYLRLRRQQPILWRNREHFVAVAVQMMRRILVDYARRRARVKRSPAVPSQLSVAPVVPAIDPLEQILAVHDALQVLAEIDPEQCEIVELSFFGGLMHQEIAHQLGISVPTVERRWRMARAWLYRHLEHSDL
jgi:RNA polymerase sigma factor (TIGR02999 family)